MKKKRWSQLFIKFGRDEAIQFFDQYHSTVPFDIISEPTEGLTMIKVREHAKNSLFYMGELLVTETKIRHRETVGLGVVKGSDEELSMAVGFIDLCFNLGLLIDELEDILDALEMKEDIYIENRTKEILKTKVDFDMMTE